MSRALDTRWSAISSQINDQSASAVQTVAATPDTAQSPLNTTTSNADRAIHERIVDQTQEAVLYTVGPWSSHANALQIALRDLARSTTRERQIQEQSVTNQLEVELMAKERKKRSALESFWFERLATVVGPSAALEVQTAVQRFCNQRGSGLETSHGALVQLSHDLSRALGSGNVIDRVAMSSRASDEILAVLRENPETILSASAEQLQESFARMWLSDEPVTSAVANQDGKQAEDESERSERTNFVSDTTGEIDERGEAERLDCEREAFTYSLKQATEELLDESVSRIRTRALTEEQALGHYRALRRERLATIDADLRIPTDSAANEAAEQAFRNSLTERINAQRQADEKTLNELATRFTQDLERGVTIGRLRSAFTPTTPVETDFDALVRQQESAIEALASQPTIAPLLARNPQAFQQLSEQLSRAAQELRARTTAANSPAPDFLAAVRSDPTGLTTFLTSADGATLLRARLQAATTPQARVELLTALRRAVGPENFSRIIQAYDQHKHIPLIADILSLNQASPAVQRDLLERCFGQGVTFFTAAERERFITYTRGIQALTLENIVAERERLPGQIAATEAARRREIEHLTVALFGDRASPGAQSLLTAGPEDQHRLILEAIHARFPSLRGKDWQRTIDGLREVAGIPSPSPSPADPPSRAAMIVPAASLEQHRDLAARLNTYIQNISQHEESLTRLRQMYTQGQHNELTVVSQSFDRLLNGLFPEYTTERFAATRTEARVYLETLRSRIANAQGEELARLIAERDSIDWRAVAIRVQLHLSGNPATVQHSQRALELLNDFQLMGAGSPMARGSHFLGAARQLTNSIVGVEEYLNEAQRLLRAQLQSRSTDVARLEAEKGEFEKRLGEQIKQGANEAWNNLYQERGRLQARRDVLGDRTVQARIDQITAEFNDAWYVQRTGTESHASAVSALAKTAESSRLRLEQAQRDVQTLKARLETDSAPGSISTIRTSLLNAVFTPENPGLPNGDPASIRATLVGCGQATPDTTRLNQLFGVIVTPRSQCLQILVNPPTGASSSFTQYGNIHGISSTIVTRTGPISNLDLITNLHSIVTTDFSSKPSLAALNELRGTIPANSEIGRHLSALGTPSEANIEQFMQQLYARLGAEDQMRVRLFLVSYDRPTIFRFVPDESLQNVPLANPANVWGFLSSLKQDQEHNQLAPLLQVIPNLRQHQVVESTLSTLSDEQAASLLRDFERVTGASLGQRLISLAPSSGALREKYLIEIIGPSRAVTSTDMAPFLGNQRVPVSGQERAEALNQLLLSDHDREFSVTEEVQRLIQSEAQERASLQVALGTMIQLRRYEVADSIRVRLAELDANFERAVSNSLQAYSPEYRARQGVRARLDEARMVATYSAQMEVADPYGRLSHAAFLLVQSLENASTPTDVIVQQIRQGNYTNAEMRLLETFYVQHVGHRSGSTTLSGDLQRDIAQRGANGQPTPGPEQLRRLLQGGNGLTEYDLIQLSEGMRTSNPHLAVRAMIALQARGLLQKAIQDLPPAAATAFAALQNSAAGKEVAAYYDAVRQNDTVRTGMIEIRNGITTGALNTATFVGDVVRYTGNLTGEQLSRARTFYRETYGTDIIADLNRGIGSLAGRWDGILSSDPVQRATSIAQAAISETGIKLDLLRHSITPNLTPEQRTAILGGLNRFVAGLPNSFMYSDGNGPSVLQYIQSRPGPTSRADAELLRQLLRPPQGTSALTPQVLDRYIMERDRLVFQLQQVDGLLDARREINRQSGNFRDTVSRIHGEALHDYNHRWTGRGLANDVVQVHQRMLNQQNDLISLQNMGIHDIRVTRELIRRRGALMLGDLVAGEDRGLTLEQNDRENRQLRVRDTARQDVWVVARREQVREWQQNAEIAKERLANWDWWVDVGHTVIKTAVIVGVSFIPGVGPLGALALATAWNFGDKLYKVVVNGMSLEEALRQFAIELVMDAAFAWIGGQAIGRIVAKGGSYGSALLKPVKGWAVVRQWMGRIPRGATEIIQAGAPRQSGFYGTLQRFGERWFGKANSGIADLARDGVKAAEVTWKKVIDGRWFWPLSGLGTAALTNNQTPQPTPMPSIADLPKGVPAGNDNSKPLDPLIVQVPPVQPQAKEKPPVEQSPTQQPQPAEQPPTTPRGAQSTPPQDEKERPAPANPQSTATATPPANTPEPVLSQATQDWIAQTLSWNMWGSLVDSILGLFKPSSTPDIPPAPAVNPPPSPREGPPPPSGDGKGPGTAPKLTTDDSRGNATGNSYTRAVEAGQTQVAVNPTLAQTPTPAVASTTPLAQGIPHSEQQLAPNSMFNAYAAAQSIRDQQTQLARDAQLAANLATADALATASRIAQAEARQAAERERIATPQSVTAATPQSVTSATPLAAARKAAPQEEEQQSRLAALRDSKETIKAQKGEIQNLRTSEQASLSATTADNAAPRLRGDVTQEKKHETAELTAATKHLVSQQESEVARIRTSQEQAASANHREQQQNSERERMVAARMMEQSRATQTHAALRSSSADTTEVNKRETSTINALRPTHTFDPHSEPIRMKVQAPLRVETPSAVAVANLADDDSSSTGDDSTRAATLARKKRALAERQKNAHFARERAIIIHQLTTQAFDRAAKAKLLRMLISLGISEKEYRELVAKLGQQEVERLAAQAHEAKKIAIEPLKIEIPVANDVPHMKTPVQRPAISPMGTQRTKGDLYASLRKQVPSMK